MPSATGYFSTITDLKAIPQSDRANSYSLLIAGPGSPPEWYEWFVYHSDFSAPADDYSFIAPNDDIGRWMRLSYNSGAGSTTVSDASTTAKGILQLAGDLAGTAASPTVPALATKASATALTGHTGNTSNPHAVTAAQIGSSTAQWNASQLQGNAIATGTYAVGQAPIWNGTALAPGTPTGQPGAAATIAVGTTTTLNPGTNATVINSGNTNAAVFDFAVPRGQVGATGPAGATGAIASLAIGTVSTLPPGSSASASLSGTTANPIISLGIPQGSAGATGSMGATGSTGATGSAATIAVGSVTTLAPGSSAVVANAGSSSAAVFNFGIPQGATGSVGPAGSTGATGSAATVQVGSVVTGSPSSSVSVTNSGSAIAAVFNFSIPRGDVGATGSVSAASGLFLQLLSAAPNTDSNSVAVFADASDGKLKRRSPSNGLITELGSGGGGGSTVGGMSLHELWLFS